MSNIAIRVEGLGKQYRIGGPRERYKTLRESLSAAASRPWNAMRSLISGNGRTGTRDSTFWALRDVNFEVRHGDVMGVIGRNGAGKSTLLKLLSRVTEPTTGYADIHGRVGSLLEVGTGFHPELTGRENIFLNGSILGMKRAEIGRHFDEIVAFAEVERFLETPVKHYSSGMYTRLAFAVAVHLEPEILVVDEVLAVGDAEFQKKCLRKMAEVSQGGHTIFFVSHNLAAVRNLCTLGLVLDGGRVVHQSEIGRAIDAYQTILFGSGSSQSVVETNLFTIIEVDVRAAEGHIVRPFDAMCITVRLQAKKDVRDPGLYVGILSSDYQRIAGLDLKDFTSIPPVSAGETVTLGFHIHSLPLLPGTYQVELHVKDMYQLHIELVSVTFPFQVVEDPVYGGRKLEGWHGHMGLRATPIAELNSHSLEASAGGDPA